jgi:hypothetical protein
MIHRVRIVLIGHMIDDQLFVQATDDFDCGRDGNPENRPGHAATFRQRGNLRR